MPVFKSDAVAITHDIAVVYSPQSGNSIVTLVDNNPTFIKEKFGLGATKGVCNALLDELRCYATISSLGQVKFPEYDPEDSESQRVIKAQSYEYLTERFEATVYRKAKHSNDWAEVGLVALKNAGGFRYRIHRLLDLLTDNIGVKLGENGKIGIAIKSVGYGSPQSYDRISFTGSWVQEYTWTSELPPAVIVNNYGSSSSPSPSPSPTPTPAPQPTTAPTFSVTRTVDSSGYVYASEDTDIVLTASGLLANYPFTVKFMSGGVAIKSDTYTSPTTTWTLTIKPSVLNNYGTKNYTIDFVHGSFTLNNPTSLNIVVPVFGLTNGATYSVGGTRTLPIYFQVAPYKESFYNSTWTWSYAKDDGAGIFVDKTDFSYTAALSYNAFAGSAYVALATSAFNNAGWGAGTYKVKATKGNYSVYSTPFVASLA